MVLSKGDVRRVILLYWKVWDISMIEIHIESFNPTIFHYRREDAPNIKYLPSDISISLMHSDFNNTHPESQISYELHCKISNEQKISSANLGHEEYEPFKLHGHDRENTDLG